MNGAWAPHGILDWALLVYVALGAWGGYRRGFVASLASLATYVAALGAASLYAQPVLAAADRTWGLPERLTSYLPAMAAPVATGFVNRALGWLAFAAVFLVAHVALGAAMSSFFRRTKPSLANAWLGLGFGAVERTMVAAVILAVAASLSNLQPLHALAALIAGSSWAQVLLGWLRLLPPAVGRWAVLL